MISPARLICEIQVMVHKFSITSATMTLLGQQSLPVESIKSPRTAILPTVEIFQAMRTISSLVGTLPSNQVFESFQFPEPEIECIVGVDEKALTSERVSETAMKLIIKRKEYTT